MDPGLVQKENLQEVSEPKVIRLEVNMLSKPFFVLARKQLPELLRKTIEEKKPQIRYEEEIITEEGKIKGIWEVHPTVTWGYAGPFDKEVFIAVHRIITREIPVKNPVRLGSLYQFCQLMSLADSGKNKKKIKEALIRIGSNSVYSENSFYLKREKCYWRAKTTERGGSFTLWSVYWRGDQLPDGSIADCIYLYLNPPYLISLNEYYIKPIDFDYYTELKSTISRRLYELLGLRFYGLKDSPYVKFEYSDLCQLLPIVQQKYFSLAQQVLSAPHKELIETKFLEKVEWEGASKQLPWFILYYPGERAIEEIAKAKEQLRALPSPKKAMDKDEFEVKALVMDMLEVLGDEQSKAFYLKIAKLCPSDLIYRCLSEVKYEAHEGLIRTTKGAVFTDKLKRYCKEWGIDLGLKTRRGD